MMNSTARLKEAAKDLLYLYQRVFFYLQQAKNEALKPLGFYNETLLILTFLAVRFDFNPSITQILGAYLVVLIAGSIAGNLIVRLGIVRYNTRITNQQNPELMLILEKLEKMEGEIKKQHGVANSS